MLISIINDRVSIHSRSRNMRTLDQVRPTLPANWYYDQEHYSRELDAIWYRDWICVGRMDALRRDGDYFVVKLGTQSIVVTRLPDGTLNAFHNTCRHRGTTLCRDDQGHFRNGRVVCPYHTWAYATDGRLVGTPGRIETEDFDAKNYSLYATHVEIWRGFIFINLSNSPVLQLDEFLGDEVNALRNWPLEDMRSVHQEKIALACNWKIFWENYSECYHCPRVHPELCKVTPIYEKGVLSAADLPDFDPEYDGDSIDAAVGGGAKTWTMNGEISLPIIQGPTEEERTQGVTFSSFASSLYVVGHPEFVRSVRIMPTGPESMELTVDWLLPSSYEAEDKQILEPILGLTRLVIQQDGDVCELNQQGLHSMRHQSGALIPQEYELWDFHESIRNKLANMEMK